MSDIVITIAQWLSMIPKEVVLRIQAEAWEEGFSDGSCGCTRPMDNPYGVKNEGS